VTRPFPPLLALDERVESRAKEIRDDKKYQNEIKSIKNEIQSIKMR